MPKSQSPLAAIRRKTSSPFSKAQRTKPGSRSSSGKDDAAERLDDVGAIITLAPPGVSQDVVSLIRYVHVHTFAEVPDRAAGMNSERIAEVLRYRQSLPPVVSVAHLHALSTSSTSTERELARLIAQGMLRKVNIPGRGKGGAAVGEGVALVQDWEVRINDSGLDDELRQRYVALMSGHRLSQTASTTGKFTRDDIQDLVRAGFLTNPSALLASGAHGLFAVPGGSSLLNIAGAGSRATTGTLAAVGGTGAVHESGGGGSTLATKENRTLTSLHVDKERHMAFSLPNTGPYLKLLTESRHHLLFLLKQLSPRHREATVHMLKEKWEGNVAGDAVSAAKRMRGEFTGKLPGQTKKWREFWGLEFEWVLEECVGAGVVEMFETGSVGLAVRAR